MAFIIGALGLLQMAAGVLILMAAKSALHETTSATAFGLGTVTLALAMILTRLDTQAAAGQNAPTAEARSNGDLITIYRMYDIRRSGSGVSAAGEIFANADAAKAYIDKRERGES